MAKKLHLPRPLSYPVPSDYVAEALRRLRRIRRMLADLPYEATHEQKCAFLIVGLQDLLEKLIEFDTEVDGRRPRTRVESKRP